MQREALSDELSRSAFEFFFWFSRFEAALKEAGFLKSEKEGVAAQPDWDQFVTKYAHAYEITPSGEILVTLAPERQIVGPAKTLVWCPVRLADCKSDLCKVVRLLKTLRNNLFHGGKSGGAGWDQPERTAALLEAGRTELHCLAALAGIRAELWQRY